ncbi:hypothetical protein IWW42_005836, partial [Coemansia sp. RSA 1085]
IKMSDMWGSDPQYWVYMNRLLQNGATLVNIIARLPKLQSFSLHRIIQESEDEELPSSLEPLKAPVKHLALNYSGYSYENMVKATTNLVLRLPHLKVLIAPQVDRNDFNLDAYAAEFPHVKAFKCELKDIHGDNDGGGQFTVTTGF